MLENHAPFGLRRVGERDKELACAMARAILHPYHDHSEFERVRKGFFMIGNTEILFAEDDDIARFRQLYGLPARKE